jgi:uncharacterized 2Fe-2S/4Fe-4S cluster protein (DUF4445 family)
VVKDPTVRLTVFPIGRTIAAKAGGSLLDAVRQAGIEMNSPCNGHGLCGKCKVRITNAPPPVEAPHPHLESDEIAAGLRLACEVDVRDGMAVVLPEDHTLDTRILEGERIHQSRLAPAVAVEKIDGRFRLLYQDRPMAPLPTWREGFVPKGIALDLGTTTLVVTLIDLLSGSELATASSVNPQTRFGHDVMTRIHHASTPDGLDALAEVVADGLNELVGRLCRDTKSDPQEILDAVIGGNTTMLHLAAAVDPSPLGRSPFTVGLESGCTFPVERFRLELNPRARVYIPPVVHAFVGSDISAGLLAVDFFHRRSPLLFMDLGTNGEMALIADGRRIVTSTAAGPAFEGMGITNGMRAAAGAIETVWANGDYLNLRTVGDAPAKGICGSGIMDLMAGLIRSGVVFSSGRLRAPGVDALPKGPFTERLARIGKMAAVRLTDRVWFTQKDIRQFQLAKSAVQTGAEMLLAAAGLEGSDLERIVIAGAFGYHLREETLRSIGIVPHGFQGEIFFAGNTSRSGAALLLTNAARRRPLEQQMGGVTHLSIAGKAEFQSKFVQNLALF